MLTTLAVTILTLTRSQVATARTSCCDPMASFLSDPSFIAAHHQPIPLRFAANEGKMVSISVDGGPDGHAYWVGPKTAHSPAVVMIHEWWGLNDYIKREAERLHDRLGYAVLAVDLYDGQVASTPAEAGKLMGAVKSERATALVTAAMKGLREGAFGRAYDRVGTIGWCFGGGWSDRAAIAGGPLVKACVMYYGMPDTDPADLDRLKAPVLMIWATQDQWINKSVVDGFKSAMANSNHPLTVVPFNAGHGFANPSNPVYNKVDADQAMRLTVNFFEKHLGS